MRAVIQGTGMHVPPTVVDNHRLGRLMDTSDEWIQQRTGIVTRHYADPGVGTSDLAVPAARQALERAGVAAEDLDYVVFATMTPDYYFPGSGAVFAGKLGLKRVPCLDIRQQCAGFVYGLQVTDALIRSGQYRTVLLIGAEVHCGFMPWKSWDVVMGKSDRTISAEEYAWNTSFRDRTVLFGDGAGAVVVSGAEDGSRGIVDIIVHTDGTLADRLWVNAGGSAGRPYFDPSMYEDGRTVPIVEGREVFRLAVTLMPEVMRAILARNGLTFDDVALTIFHQANLRINEAVQKRLGLSDERVYNNIQRFGNTTAATIPIALHELIEQGRVKRGDLLCFVGLGSGLNWGAVLYRY
jgi:3-oxoacyl-[acyl-carrier-protein] synthase III